MSFLTFLNALWILIIAQSLDILFHKYSYSGGENYIEYNLKSNPYTVFMIILWTSILWFILPLLWFHIFLIWKGTTTHEYLSKSGKLKFAKINPEVIKLKEHNIKNVSSSSIIPLNYADMQPKIKKIASEGQEKVSFSNRVNEDLLVDYKNVEPPPTERFFDTFSYSREETKQSLKKNNALSQRKTTREIQNTDTTFQEYFNAKGNYSYISDQSVNMIIIENKIW